MMEGERRSLGRRREDVPFPSVPGRMQMQESYAAILGQIKEWIRSERLCVVKAANSSMVLLYRDVWRMVLELLKEVSWGAKGIDRLSAGHAV